MSIRRDKLQSLLGIDVRELKKEDLITSSRDLLESGMHGVCFSPYEGSQRPGDPISEEQIRRKLELLRPYTEWIRTFSCTEQNEMIPKLAKEYGFKTLVGAWLGEDLEKNEEELQGLINLCNSEMVDIAAVGNEVMYREELSEDKLIDYIHRVKNEIKRIPIGYVDAYYEFTDHPKIAEACDVILANCYPYWEGCSIDYSLIYMKQMYQQAQRAATGKPVIITETGWPSEGESLGAAVPGYKNALKYFIDAISWSKKEEIPMFYFSCFDEPWKVSAEGSVGAFWGLWDQNHKLKF